jgi:hypothetical protein
MQSAIDQEDKVLFEEFRRGEARFATVGSTVTIVLANLEKGELVVGNLGDSHAILAEMEGGSGELGSVVCILPKGVGFGMRWIRLLTGTDSIDRIA